MGNDLRRIRDEHRSNVPNHRRTRIGVSAPPAIKVDSDNSAFLLHRHFRFPSDVFALEPSDRADEQDIGSCHVDAHPAKSFDVGFVFRVNLALELAIAKIEVDVLMSFPCSHEVVAMNIRAAETDESTRKAHVFEYG